MGRCNISTLNLNLLLFSSICLWANNDTKLSILHIEEKTSRAISLNFIVYQTTVKVSTNYIWIPICMSGINLDLIILDIIEILYTSSKCEMYNNENVSVLFSLYSTIRQCWCYTPLPYFFTRGESGFKFMLFILILTRFDSFLFLKQYLKKNIWYILNMLTACQCQSQECWEFFFNHLFYILSRCKWGRKYSQSRQSVFFGIYLIFDWLMCFSDIIIKQPFHCVSKQVTICRRKS